MGLRIKGVRFYQHHTEFLIGYARAGDILKQSSIDEWSPANPKGYQREVIERRAKEYGNFIVKDGISPNAVILNIRDKDLNNIKKISEYEYEIPDEIHLWIVDGQHRLKGLEIMGINHPVILDLNIPIVIMNLKSPDPEEARKKEATQFLIINKTQKGVRSDLAERILVQAEEKKVQTEDFNIPNLCRPESLSDQFSNKNDIMKCEKFLRAEPYHDYFEQNVLPNNIRREMSWKPQAIRISDLLNNRLDSPLQGRMKLPNARPRGTTVSQVSVVSSLKNVLSTSPFSDLPSDTLASVLINLWKAVRELCRDPFQEVEVKQRADNYVLLKTTGIFVIPKLLLGLNLYLPRKDGLPIYTVDVFKQFLSRAGDLMESGFWRSSGPGTAGVFGTGQKSFSHIAQLIIKRITLKGDGQGKQKVILF